MKGYIHERDIEWTDLDAIGHVNNISILRYVQASRIHYLEQAEDSVGGEKTCILAHVECDYKQQLYYPGHIRVESHVDSIGNKSLVMLHTVLNEKGEVAATARDVLVSFDYENNRPCPVPQILRERIAQMEGWEQA